MLHQHTNRLWVMTICVVATLSGCGDEIQDVGSKVQQVTQQVQQQVDQGVETVKQQASLAGSLQISLKEPLDVNACYATLAVLSAPRQSVLQLRSYKLPDQESFPSVFLRAPVEVGAPAELAGKTVSAQLYIQQQQDGPVWHSRPSEPVELSIEKVQDQQITAQVTRGTLVNTDTGETIEITGTFAAVY